MSTSVVDENLEPAGEHVRRPSRRPRFLRMLVAVTAAIHIPVVGAVIALAERLGWPHPWLMGWAWGAAGVLLFVRRAGIGGPDVRRNEWLIRWVDIPYFIHWCAAVWTLIPSVVATLVAPFVDVIGGMPIHLPMDIFMWSYLSGLVVCGYGTLIRRRWYRVVEREVRILGLDPRLDGLRIAHLSDLHIGSLTPRSWGVAWSLAANRHNPDLAVVTGDLVTSGTEFHTDVADVIAALHAERGVFVSMGNHDYFGDGEPLVAKLRARGVRVLRNEGAVVDRAGAKIWLAAIDDTWTRRDDLASALRGRPAGAMTVLLAHDPNRFDEAADAGVDLVLSGHTHGGQIGVPFLYRFANLATFAYRYTVGFYRRGRAVLYVHPGLGTTGPPMRLGVAPEVSVLVLRSGLLRSPESP
jgi:predicted MPP superfamily phosphohydrolase